MTRINVVPVTELSDEHLKGEIFELPRLFPLVLKAIERGDSKIPETYRMGTGHMKFFYDKLGYLFRRFNELRSEAHRRNIPIVTDPAVDPAYLDVRHYGDEIPQYWWQDYEPTEEALAINRSRLAYRRNYPGGIYS